MRVVLNRFANGETPSEHSAQLSKETLAMCGTTSERPSREATTTATVANEIVLLRRLFRTHDHLYVTRVSASHTKLSMRRSENSPVEELEKKKDRTRSRSATNALGRAVIRKRINIWVFGMETSSNVAPVDKFENLLRRREPLSWQTSSEARERPRKFKICPLVSFEVLRALRATLRQIRFDFEIQTRERGSKFMGLLK